MWAQASPEHGPGCWGQEGSWQSAASEEKAKPSLPLRSRWKERAREDARREGGRDADACGGVAGPTGSPPSHSWAWWPQLRAPEQAGRCCRRASIGEPGLGPLPQPGRPHGGRLRSRPLRTPSPRSQVGQTTRLPRRQAARSLPAPGRAGSLLPSTDVLRVRNWAVYIRELLSIGVWVWAPRTGNACPPL